MYEKVKVQVFGIEDQIINLECGCSREKDQGCCKSGDKKDFCKEAEGNCSNKGCCANNRGGFSKTVGESYGELKKFINASDISNNVEFEFIDLRICNTEDDKFIRIKELLEKGFDPPITVIDNIIRYYGGISNTFVYKDIKELLE
jgi:hypothetical protein